MIHNRIVPLLFVGAAILYHPLSFAQSCITYPSCGWYSFDSGCTPALPPTVYDCMTAGPWSMTCKAKTDQCAPPKTQDECLECRRAVAGKPIDLSTGNTYISQADIAIPGLAGGLSLIRTWNSKWPASQGGLGGSTSGSGSSGGSGVGGGGSSGSTNPQTVGLFGLYWRSTYEDRVFPGEDGYMKYSRGDGSFWSFGVDSLGPPAVYGVAAPANKAVTLTVGSSYWTMTFQSGEQRFFDNTTGSLLSITDRNGNRTQLSYDAANRLITVTDPAGRHLYFIYPDPSSYLVTGVNSDVGIALSYTYDGSNRLTRVTRPDSSTVSFEYNGDSLITAVKDSDGKILESHTYDSQGRGLSSSRAGGVDAVTVSYPKPDPPILVSN